MKNKTSGGLCLLLLSACVSSPPVSAPQGARTQISTSVLAQEKASANSQANPGEAAQTPSGPDTLVTAVPAAPPPEPVYKMEFQTQGDFPSFLTGKNATAKADYFLHFIAKDPTVKPSSLAVSYSLSPNPWKNSQGQFYKADQAPLNLPQQWTVKVYPADPEGNKHGFPVAQTTINTAFASITWNGVTQDGKIAPEGRYTFEVIPEGFPQLPIENVLSLSQFAPPSKDIPPPDYVPDELLVKFKDVNQAKNSYTIESTNEAGWSVVKADGRFKVSAESDTSKAATEINNKLTALAQVLATDPNVSQAEPNLIFQTQLSLNDPEQGQLYALEKVKAFDAWDIQTGQDNVTIAVVDTGIDPNHPDLKSKLVAGFNGLDQSSNSRDDHGHGTHVAGIAAGIGNNGTGIAGLGFGAKLMPIKVLGAQGQGDTYAVARGVQWAADHGADVINLSLGGRMGASVLLDAINHAVSKGSVVVVAMGNDGGQVQNFPAAYAPQVPSLIAVGSTDSADQRSYFSNYGSWISIAAPGTQIYSTLPGYSVPMNQSGNLYGNASGTSMATPYVAGLAALLKSQKKSYSPLQVKQAIQEGADDLGASGFDTQFGAGRINAWKTLNLKLPEPSPTPVPTPTPTPGPTPTPSATSAPQPTGFGGLILDLS